MARGKTKKRWKVRDQYRCRRCDGLFDRVAVEAKRHYLCHDCAADFLSEWSAHIRSDEYESHMRRTYGLASEQHAAMFLLQQGVCAICRDPDRSMPTGKPGGGLVVDHNHETGEVRGLLCSRCNAAIGMLADDEGSLRRAYYYLTGRRMRVPKGDKVRLTEREELEAS